MWQCRGTMMETCALWEGNVEKRQANVMESVEGRERLESKSSVVCTPCACGEFPVLLCFRPAGPGFCKTAICRCPKTYGEFANLISIGSHKSSLFYVIFNSVIFAVNVLFRFCSVCHFACHLARLHYGFCLNLSPFPMFRCFKSFSFWETAFGCGPAVCYFRIRTPTWGVITWFQIPRCYGSSIIRTLKFPCWRESAYRRK